MDYHHATLASRLWPNATNATDGDISDAELFVVNSFRVLFTTLGIVTGVFGIACNTALLVLCAPRFSSSGSTAHSVSLSTKSLIASLAAADVFLLIFGLPYDLVAANDYPWLEGRRGCQLSAFLPEASRFVWLGSVVLAFLLNNWPASLMKARKVAPAWVALVWTISAVAAIPFILRVDCLGVAHSPSDYESAPEAKSSKPTAATSGDDSSASCFCVFTVNQPEVAKMFSIPLAFFLLIPGLTIGAACYKSRTSTSDDHAPNLKRNTSSRTLVNMLFAFMGCTVPRYVYLVVNYSEFTPVTSRAYELAMSATEVLCYCLFYGSTLIHVMVSPHPRSLLRRLFRRRHKDYSVATQAT